MRSLKNSPVAPADRWPHDREPCECLSFGEHYDRGGSFDGWNARLRALGYGEDLQPIR